VRSSLLNRVTGGDILTGLLPASQTERRRRRQPVGQNREGLPAGMTDPATHPNAFTAGVVGLAEPPSMADDRAIAANRTTPWQKVQRDHPGSMLSFASGSAIKRITAGVKARRDRPCQISICRPGLHPPAMSASNEKRIQLFTKEREPLVLDIGRFISTFQPVKNIGKIEP
jgi:hypothetical protein